VILMAEIDRAQIVRGKFDLDVVGHYARPDIFQLHVDERPKRPVTARTLDGDNPSAPPESSVNAKKVLGQGGA